MNMTSSMLNPDAEEFIPGIKTVPQEALRLLRTSIIKTLTSPGQAFLDEAHKLAKACDSQQVAGARLLGDSLARIATAAPNYVDPGFRLLLTLQEHWSSVNSAPELNEIAKEKQSQLESGVFTRLHELTVSVLIGNRYDQVIKLSSENSNSSDAMPKLLSDIDDTSANNVCPLSLIRFHDLVIRRLYMSDNSDTQVCIPPAETSVDFCRLISTALRLQLNRSTPPPYSSTPNAIGGSVPATGDNRQAEHQHNYHMPNSVTSNGDDATTLAFAMANVMHPVRNAWNDLLLEMLDKFAQCLPFFCYLLVSEGSASLSGDWQRNMPESGRKRLLRTAVAPLAAGGLLSAGGSSGGSLLVNATGGKSASLFASACLISELINSILTLARHLVTTAQLPLATTAGNPLEVRNAAMDLLMYAAELGAIDRTQRAQAEAAVAKSKSVCSDSMDNLVERSNSSDSGGCGELQRSIYDENEEVQAHFMQFLRDTNQM